MSKDKTAKNPVTILKQAVNTFFTDPLILAPFITIAFIQLLILELLYFAPRWPLSVFFGPVIERLWGEFYLHYPFNLIILPKMFQYAQIPIYIFVSSFFIGVAITIIGALNAGKETSLKAAAKSTLGQYVHIFIAGLISFVCFYGLYNVYGLLVRRAYLIRSAQGPLYILKQVVLEGAPYFNLILGALITTVFAFVLPIIVLERAKVFTAIVESFKAVFQSFFLIFFVVLIPTLFYVPVLLLRNNTAILAESTSPGIRFFVLIFSVLVMVLIDATVYTAVTTHYLIKRESAA